MVRVITQETYDEVVNENMEEFDMTAEEAIKEAVAQFEAQGVDLSNIIKDLALGSGDNHQVSTSVKKLKDLCSQNQPDELILKELEILKTECTKDIARRVRAGKEGAYSILIDLLERRLKSYIEDKNERDEDMTIKTLEALVALMDMQPDLLEQKGLELIKRILDDVDSENVLVPALKWTTVCCIKHEMNRQLLFAKNIADNLQKLVVRRPSAKVMSETMQVIRKLTLDDDVRVEFGKAHDHARELGTKLLEPLTKYLKDNVKPPAASEAMLTLAALLVRHELCARACEAGADAALFHVLAAGATAPVAVQASKLIVALAGNDDVKRKLMQAGIAPIIVSSLSTLSSNAAAVALFLKCISALSLREPAHGRQFFDCGAPEAMVHAMKVHPDDASVQKNGCWAIRNMVARCREQNPHFHELGVEAVLQEAHERFAQEFGFDIKSALRDLECDVKLDEQWTGRGVQMTND